MDDAGHKWKRKKQLDRFKVARDGDSFMTPFQCDLCVFHNLQHREPDLRLEEDWWCFVAIRRVILDSFWAREPRTVSGNGATLRRSLKFARKAGLRRLYRNPGPMPLEDHCGYGVAISMVLASLEGGKHCADHTQFDTIRNYSAAFSNHFRTTADGSGLVLVMGDEDGKRKHFSSCPTKSEWFARFLSGCKLRMGQDVRQNQALGPKVVKAMLDLILEEITEITETTHPDKAAQESNQARVRLLVTVGAFVAVGFVGSFRGNEPFMIDLDALRKWLPRGIDGEDGSRIICDRAFIGTIQEREERTDAPASACLEDEIGNRAQIVVGRSGVGEGTGRETKRTSYL